jgi:hypothetical protein
MFAKTHMHLIISTSFYTKKIDYQSEIYVNLILTGRKIRKMTREDNHIQKQLSAATQALITYSLDHEVTRKAHLP